MRIAEEILLLLLDEDTGYFAPIPSWDLSCVFAGAVLADLALGNCVDTDLESLVVLDPSPVGDELLDPVLKDIADEEDVKGTQYWVEKTAHRSETVIESVLDRLVDQGILEYDQAGYWSLTRSAARSRKFVDRDGTVKTEVRSRILKTLFEDVIPDPRDVILIGLAHTVDALRHLMEVEDYEEVKDRIELISKMDLISRTLAEAVRGICVRPPPMRYAASKEIPRLGFWKLLRNKRARGYMKWRSTSGIASEIYRAHGSVVEIKVPFNKQKLVMLIGPNTNKWFHKSGRNYLRTKDYIWNLEQVFGASRSLPGMDGAEHFRLRKSLNRGYSRASLEGKLEKLFFHGRSSLQEWKVGDALNGTSACRSLVARQVSHIAIGVDTSEFIEDVLDYQHRALSVRVMHALPEFSLHTPGMKKKRKRLIELLGKVRAEHTPGLRVDQKADLVDEFLRVHTDDPQFLPQSDLNMYFIATLITGIYLGSGLAFSLSTMTSHPEVYEKIKAEADALFSNGNPSAEDFTPEAVDTTYRLFKETQRIFPVVPVQIRHVMNPCNIEGHEIPVGTRLIVAMTGSHFLDEHFPNPLQFDVDRFLPEPEENLDPYVYAPFGLGTHKCLGARWVDLHIVANILLIAHHLELSSSPSSYDLKVNPIPTNAPNKDFSLTVKGIRNSLPV